MPRQLPPLNALKAFEAAARHLSFTLAAEELHVTQAAVSHQVKGLEAQLGVKLFRRMPRQLFLTEEGQALLPELTDAFDRLAQAVSRVGQQGAAGPLTVTLLTTFALGWLVPRLDRFQALHPGIDVRLGSTAKVVDFAREDVDCGIRNGAGQWPGLFRQHLFEDIFTPLCTPALAQRLQTPDDLRRVTLLQTIGYVNEWSQWLAGAGVTGVDVARGPAFDSTLIAVQAALRGLGVAVGDPRFFQAELAAGLLVQPFDLLVPMQKSWWFVCLPAMAERPKIRLFRDWLAAEAAAMPALAATARPAEP